MSASAAPPRPKATPRAVPTSSVPAATPPPPQPKKNAKTATAPTKAGRPTSARGQPPTKAASQPAPHVPNPGRSGPPAASLRGDPPSQAAWSYAPAPMGTSSGSGGILPVPSAAEVRSVMEGNSVAALAQILDPFNAGGMRFPDDFAVPTETFTVRARIPLSPIVQNTSTNVCYGFQMVPGLADTYRTITGVGSTGSLAWTTWDTADPAVYASLQSNYYVYRTIGCGFRVVNEGKGVDMQGVAYTGFIPGQVSGNNAPTNMFDNILDMAKSLSDDGLTVITPNNLDGESFRAATTTCIWPQNYDSDLDFKIPTTNISATTGTATTGYACILPSGSPDIRPVVEVILHFEGIPNVSFRPMSNARSVAGSMQDYAVALSRVNLALPSSLQNAFASRAAAVDALLRQSNGLFHRHGSGEFANLGVANTLHSNQVRHDPDVPHALRGVWSSIGRVASKVTRVAAKKAFQVLRREAAGALSAVLANDLSQAEILHLLDVARCVVTGEDPPEPTKMEARVRAINEFRRGLHRTTRDSDVESLASFLTIPEEQLLQRA